MKLQELQEELAGVLFSIDKILKNNLKLQTAMSKELQKPLAENMALTIQINLLNNIKKFSDSGRNKEEIINALKPIKANFAKQVRAFNNQLKMASDIKICEEKYDSTQTLDFENEYSLLIRTAHPLITLTKDQINIATFNLLRQFYMIGNIDGYKGLLNEHPITNHPISNEEEAIKRLEQTLKVYKEQLGKLEADPKFNKFAEILNDEALLAREESALRQQSYKFKEQINTLKADLNKVYPEGYEDLLK